MVRILCQHVRYVGQWLQGQWFVNWMPQMQYVGFSLFREAPCFTKRHKADFWGEQFCETALPHVSISYLLLEVNFIKLIPKKSFLENIFTKLSLEVFFFNSAHLDVSFKKLTPHRSQFHKTDHCRSQSCKTFRFMKMTVWKSVLGAFSQTAHWKSVGWNCLTCGSQFSKTAPQRSVLSVV